MMINMFLSLYKWVFIDHAILERCPWQDHILGPLVSHAFWCS